MSNDLQIINNKKQIVENNKIKINDFTLPDKAFNLEEYIRSIIKKVLEKYNGNKTKAAKYLGLSRSQLYYRYKEDK